ncbi:hypothetical protein P8452_08633 [Trifolium repens]|nr:hypothetical protein P8452_08633 [Trifolium repens]
MALKIGFTLPSLCRGTWFKCYNWVFKLDDVIGGCRSKSSKLSILPFEIFLKLSLFLVGFIGLLLEQGQQINLLVHGSFQHFLSRLKVSTTLKCKVL